MKLPAHSPYKYGFDPKSPPSTPLANVDEGKFSASFDQRLWMFQRSWEPPAGTKVRATLMIVHGTVDHSGAYAELGHKLAQQGIAVFAMDMRGWGLSDGESMYLDSMDTFVADVHSFYLNVHSQPRYNEITSRYLMGKSLGGSVTAFCVAKHPTLWTGIIGLSGAYEVDTKLTPSPLVMTLLKGLALLAPKLPLKPLFDEHLIVSDENALQNWRDDPLCSKDKLRLGYIVIFFDCLDNLTQDIAQQIDLPMLMMCGNADRVVTMSGHQLMLDKNRHNDKQLKVYANGLHNLLQEPNLKLQVMSDIQEWILERSFENEQL